ncbi:MAG: endonuclease/exonuclease/phosphatase family protein [Chitinophagaceae bacterium]|nr:MAG: endonuclease/exonuclease/phosphatase family protein [Chitinophagaceae bacterium]
MKVIAWNCNMAFRKKAPAILAHAPDILVVPECEHPDKLLFAAGVPRPTDSLWFGDNLNKGLGVFSYSGYRFRTLDTHRPELKTIVPIAVTGGGGDFTLFAVWANNPADRDGPYITQVWKALAHYGDAIGAGPTILAGDFNSNSIWDRPRREGNHSTVVARLESKGIGSVYHRHFDQQQGREQHPTHYLYRHAHRPYHLDYCFASADLLARLRSVEVGDHDTWSPYSDHMPLVATFDL